MELNSVILSDLRGRIKTWVTAGTGGFKKKRERTSPQVIISLSLRISNMAQRRKLKYLKIKFAGPSKTFREKVYYTLKNRAWKRHYTIICLEESYSKAFNGCRLSKEKKR